MIKTSGIERRRRDRDDEIGCADELWVENENEIGNDGADKQQE